MFQYIAKGIGLRFPENQEFCDPYVSAAVLDTCGLGANKNIVYGCRCAGVVTAPKWFHSGAYLSFVARPFEREVERYFCRAYRAPLGMGL